jgi:hypothetical protein
MSEPSKPMPLLGYTKEKPIFGTSNFWPMAALCIAGLGSFWNFSAAQTKQESSLVTIQKDQAKMEEKQKELRLDIKEELKSVNQKVDSLQQILVNIQLQLVEIKQQKK